MPNRKTLAERGADFYPTPPWATRALLECEDFDGSIWEPACGDGAMATVLTERGPVVATDLHNHGYGIGEIDFLTTPPAYAITPHIVTNPPFRLAEKFVNQALLIAEYKVAMLLRLCFLEGANREQRLFRDHPPTRIHVFSERVTMYPKDAEIKGTSTTAIAWFVWDKSVPNGPPGVYWIPKGTRARLSA